MVSTYNNDPLGYYKELGVGFNADSKEIKQNYRDRAKEWHPDYNDSPEALEKFQKISVAYDILQDETNRLRYDLLSQVYNSKNFPDMFALKVYKNQKGRDDTGIRALVLKKKGKDIKEICNYNEAKFLVLKNFLLNFWNIKDIIYNFKNMDKHYQENLTLMLHNAIAYDEEGSKDRAYIFATIALEYADDYTKGLIERFTENLNISHKVKPSYWNFKVLRLYEIIVPLLLGIMFLLPYSSNFVTDFELNNEKEINYYQEVRFRTGGETTDDVVVSKVLSYPVDVNDLSMLYHAAGKLPVMYGPSGEFDVITKIDSGHTVRVTGVTPDKIWFRVMLDNGDMGFIPTKYLKKGIGGPIPEGSKIFEK